MFDARQRLLDARSVANRHPPQCDGRSFEMFEPIGAAAIEALVYGLPDKALECIDAFPDRKIDDDTRIGAGPCVGGVAALVDIAPDKAGAALGNPVHQCKVVGEIRHARIIEFVSDTADVELCKVCLLYTSDAADDLLCVDLGG